MEEQIRSEYDFHNTPSKISAATDKEKHKCIMDCNTPSSMAWTVQTSIQHIIHSWRKQMNGYESIYVPDLVWHTLSPCTVQNWELQEETIIRLPARYRWRNNFFRKGHRGWHSQQYDTYEMVMSVSEKSASWKLIGLMSSTSLYGWVAPTCMPWHKPGQVQRHHKCPPNYQPSETDERLLRVDPKWWAWSWTGRPGRSAGSGSDGPNTCSWSSNCCANCSSNLWKYLRTQKIQIFD